MIRFQFIASALFKLFGHIVAPIGAFQLKAIYKKRPEMIFQRAQFGDNGIRHSVEIMFDRLFAVMIEYLSPGTWRTAHYRHKSGKLYQAI